MKYFLEQWGWETPRYQLTIALLTASCLAATAVACRSAGLQGLWALLSLLLPLLYAILYRFIGKRVARTRAEGSIDCIIARRTFEAPGTAILDGTQLTLCPIFLSPPIVIDLKTVTRSRKSHRFNGRGYFCKTGFWFETPDGMQTGFAVGNTSARTWQTRLLL